MDTTEKYIRMCEKAGEVQEGWKLKEQDLYAVVSSSFRKGYDIDYIDGYYRQIKEEFWLKTITERHSIGMKDVKIVWLPSQDQLQEMINWSPLDHPHTLIAMFYDFDIKWLKIFGSENLVTMEQLWLAFIVYEKHGRMWDDKKEEWILK